MLEPVVVVIVVPPEVIVVVVVPLALTVIEPFISLGCTEQKKVYVPGCENVHVPFHFVAPVSGTPAHAGLIALDHMTSCWTLEELFWKATVPPVPIVALTGDHACVSP